MKVFILFASIALYVEAASNETNLYSPDWSSLDSRPLPSWYDAAKIGIMVHWGIYSVPSYGPNAESFWYNLQSGNPVLKKFMRDVYKNRVNYTDFALMFKPEAFNPDQWAQLFAISGAKYVVFTAKHHDGFAMFPSGRTNWNSVDLGPKVDFVGALSESVKKMNMKFGIYYSLGEWYNKLFVDDRLKSFSTTHYVDNIVWPDLQFLVNSYTPSVLWADGHSRAKDTYWKSKEFLAWLYNESPVKDDIVVNDRWGKGTDCHHGGFYNCKSSKVSQSSLGHKWEHTFSLDKGSWGFRRDMRPTDVLSIEELLLTVVSTVSGGGNALINIGATSNGTIPRPFQLRLKQMGEFLAVNEEAIYNTSPCLQQNDKINKAVWYTCKSNDKKTGGSKLISAVYAIFLKWPKGNLLQISNIANYCSRERKCVIQMLKSTGYQNIGKYKISNDTLTIDLSIERIEAHTFAWVLKFSRAESKPKTHTIERIRLETSSANNSSTMVYTSVNEHFLGPKLSMATDPTKTTLPKKKTSLKIKVPKGKNGYSQHNIEVPEDFVLAEQFSFADPFSPGEDMGLHEVQ